MSETKVTHSTARGHADYLSRRAAKFVSDEYVSIEDGDLLLPIKRELDTYINQQEARNTKHNSELATLRAERDALRSRLELAEAVCRAADKMVGRRVMRGTTPVESTVRKDAVRDALTAWESAQPKEPRP